MPRTWDTDLQTIFQAYKRRDKLVINRNDGTTLSLSRGNIAGCSNWIRSVSDMTGTIDQSVDRVSFDCQNVSSDMGFDLASNLRLLDYSLAEYSKQYQSLRNPALIQDKTMFRGVVANAEADEEHFGIDLIVDYESSGSIIASRGLGPLCWWVYKNGIECTSASGEMTCPRTRNGCIKRGVEHQFGGWEFFQNPTTTPPRTPGGGILPCFTLDTRVWLLTGDIPIGMLPLGKLREPIPCVSFDPATGDVCYDDEIIEVWEHDADGYFSFRYAGSSTRLNVTPEHNLWDRNNSKFKPADQWKIGDKAWRYSDKSESPSLKQIRWNSDATVRVRNLTTRKNHTYFANRIAVSNSKGPGIGGGDL
ncbi:MAG: Hint domain-containing protein [Pyrinomonadaceae bacterium]